MGIPSLSQFLGTNGHQEYVGQLILLSDTITDGSFLVHHFLSQALKSSERTVLLSFSQALIHYNCVCSKLGVNLQTKIDQGLFHFLDGLTSLLSHIFPPSDSAQPVAGKPPTPRRPGIQFGSDWCLQDIFQHIQELVTATEKKRDTPVCLILDSLSILLNVGVALRDVMVLVQQCLHLLTSPQGPCKGRGYVVVMVHQEEGKSSEPEHLLHTHLLHLSYLHLQATGLTTGYSKDLHGELTASWRDPMCTGRQVPSRQDAHYKLSDKTVQIFPKGMSKAVL